MRWTGAPVVLAVSLILAPFIAEGAASGEDLSDRLSQVSACPEQFGLTNLRQGLRERGYVEGHNIVLACRDAAGTAERFSDLAAELTRLNVDVLVTESTVAAQAPKQATKTVPP